MAEFKLGRIKFVYQGAWTPGTSYVVDDVVTVGGKTYICIITNTSSSLFSTDLNNITPYWTLIADGQTWRGTWANSTLYNLGDLSQYGGTVYQCTTSHTSSNSTLTITATGLTTNGSGTATLTYATQSGGAPFVVGQTITLTGFTPTSTTGTVNTVAGTYTILTCTNNQLTFALTGTYTATAPFGTVSGVSGLESEINYWTPFASNLNWIAGGWQTSTRYKVDDFIYYGGITYVCNTAHVSASTTTLGLEANSGLWSTFNAGLNYLGSWSGSSVRYKLNDIVRFGADLWICTTPHTSTGTSINASNFTIFVNGFEFVNSYNSGTAYIVGDVVTYGGYTYTCIQNGTNQTPSTATSYWQVFTSGITFVGSWNSSTAYKIGQAVTLGGYSYIAVADNTSSQPPSSNWTQLNSGIRWNAAPQTVYSAVAGTNLVSANGNNAATFDITTTGTAYTVVVHSGSGGSGYAVNDTLTILGTSLGGTVANNLIVKVATISGSAIATVTVVSGYASTWQAGIVYVAGDAVYYGNSSFICINAHIGASGNNPIADTTATYWNLLASGADSGVLTTTGDMVYYGATGPTRLPVGTDGQVLRVNGNVPAWSYYGLLTNVVYVATNGTDSSGNGQGLTIDKPWASVQYACKQIEDGYLNTNAGLLLKINKQFMMKEVQNYILTNYSFNVTGTSGSGNTFIVGGSSTSSQTTTSNMYSGMPIVFSGATGGVTPGTIYYVNTIPSTTTFTISTTYKSGSTLGITASSSVASIATFSYTQSKAERDAGTLIDCVIFDLTHGGNLYIETATQTFFSTLTSYISNNATYEMTVWIASLTYLSNTLFAKVLSNTAPTIVYQTLQGIPAAQQATQNTTEVLTTNVETNAVTTAQSLLNILVNALSAGTYANIPQIQRPKTTIYLKTGTYNEYGPILIPQDTALIGDELRSTIVQMATANSYLANDKTRMMTAMQRIQNTLPAIINNIPITVASNLSPSYTQKYINNTSPTYSTATQSIINNNTTLQNILTNGFNYSSVFGSPNTTVTPGMTLSTTQYGTLTVATGGAFTFGTPLTSGILYTGQVVTVTGTFASGNGATWTGYTTGNNYLISATNGSSTFTLTTMLGAAITTSAGTITGLSFTQNLSVPNTGTFSLSTPTGFGSSLINTAYACTGNATGATTGYPAGVTAIANNISFIQTEIAAYMYANYNSVWAAMGATYQAQTLRDLSAMLASVEYDMTYGGNSQSQISGLAYYSLGTSSIISAYQAATNAMLVRVQTIIPYIVQGLTAGWTKTTGNTATQNTSSTGSANAGAFAAQCVGTVITVFSSGTDANTNSQSEGSITGSTITLPYYGWATQAQQTAFLAIQNQKSYIQQQIQNFVAVNYANVVPNLSLTYRDAGTITDALSYDMVLGTNFFTVVAGRAFYRYVTSAQTLVGGAELKATQDSINYIAYLTASVSTNSSALPAVTGDLGNISAVNLVVNNTSIIQNMFANGLVIASSNNTNYTSTNGILGTLQEPSFNLSPVTGYNTYYLVSYGNAVNQLAQNYQFIRDEIIGYLITTISATTWAGYGPAYQAETVRDLYSILDALQYDLTYGCNNQSLIVGSSYFSLNTPLITSAYSAGVTATLNRLNTILPYILNPSGNGTLSAGPGANTTTSQITTGSSGSAASVAFAQARIADIQYWLANTGPNTTTGTTTGTISGTTLTLTSGTGFAIGQCITGATLTTTITGTNSNGNVTISSTTGLASGMAITFSTPYNYSNQFAFGGLTQTTYTINTVGSGVITLYTYGTTIAPSLTTATGLMTAVAGIAPGTYITAGSGTSWTVSVSQTVAATTAITGTFAITPLISGASTFATQANLASFNAIQARATEIANDATTWVTKFYQNESPSLTLTTRDAGYVVTALSYDVLFNSNFYSIITGRSYNRLIPLSAALQTTLADSTYGSIGFIGERVKLLAANGSVVQTQAVIDELTAQIAGQPTNNVVFNGSINGTQLTVNSITSGVLTTNMTLSGIGVNYGTQLISGATTSITGAYISSTSGVFSLASALSTALVVGQTVTISGSFSAGSISSPSYVSGTTYYVIGNPTTTAFQLSATQGGNPITTTTGGSSGSPITGITIIASPTTWLLNYSQSVSSTTTSISAVSPTVNYITMGTTAGMVPGLQITISGTSISNLSAGVYYIKQVLSATQLTISSSYNGSVFSITPNNTLTGVVCTGINGTFTCNATSSTMVVGQSIVVSGTLSGITMSTSTGTYSSLSTVYYIIATNGTTSFTLSTAANGQAIVTTAGTPTGVTFTNGSIGSMTAIVYGIYNGLSTTTSLIASGTTIPVTAVTTSTNLITVNSNAGIYPNMPVVFNNLPSNITTTAVSTTTSTNVITLASSVSSLGILAGQKVYFTGLMLGTIVVNQYYYVVNPTGSTIQISNTLGGTAVALTSSPVLSTVAITGTAGQFSCASYAPGLVVGQAITINGTLSAGTINGSSTVTATTFYVIASSGSTNTTSFTLSATLGGVAITTTASGGTITGTTFGVNAQMSVVINAAGGLVNGNTYWVNSVTAGTYPASGTTITVTNSYKSGTALTITNSLTGLTANAVFGIQNIQNMPSKIVNGTVSPGFNQTANYSATGYNNSLTTITGAELLRLNFSLLIADAIQYVQNVYGATVTSTSSAGLFTTSTPHQLLVGDPVQFGLTGTLFDQVNLGNIYWVLTTPSSTTFTVSNTQPGTGTQSTYGLIGITGSMSVNYYIVNSRASKDIGNLINGLIYDLGKTGNYKSTRFMQLYLSQVTGSTAINLFQIQNGTGIRNMTCNGLTGSLTIPNSYGTKRPTAGAYVSFDPGFGANDSSAWIYQRSPYTQNITNFGNGCIGMKIDASLHNGGSKSMVSNDFTQVLSDGIGIYCTGHGAITEAVSVFCYYGYAGYLSEFGGRIRATNGNSSYGTYGVIAEGIDSYETPIYATLNNRANPTYVTNTVTDAANQIYRLEYENAGNAYTNATPSISGAGYNVVVIQDEFRDSSVFETRLVDLNNGQGVGGSNYLTISNTAQSGALGSITIANSDTNLSSAYVGMRVQITAGTGVGQYANIVSYSSSTKIANVYRSNFVPLTITNSSTTVFTVSTNTNTLYASQPIYLFTTIAGLTLSTVYYVVGASLSNNGTTFSVATSATNAASNTIQSLTATSSTPATMAQSTIVGTVLTISGTITNTIYIGMLLSGGTVASNTYIVSGSGTSWTVSVSQNMSSATLTGTISVPLYEAGWDHVIPGVTIQNTLDATSTYIIEPAISYTSPGLYGTSSSLVGTATWSGLCYGSGNFVAVAAGSTTTSYSTNGKTWSAGGVLPSSTTWNNVAYGGGQGATATAIIGGLGGSGASLTANLGSGTTAGQILTITVVNGGYNYTSSPTIVITDSLGTGATAVAQVLNGTIQSVTMSVTGSGYTNPTVTVLTNEISSITSNAWGSNYFASPTVTISPPVTATAWGSLGSATANSYYYYVDTSISPNVRNYYQAGATGTFTSTAPTFTNSLYGKSGYGATGVGSSATYGVQLTYVGTLAVATANLTNNGVSSFTLTQTGYGYTSVPTITVTDPNAGFVAISSASTANAYNLPSTLSSAWTANTNVLPTSTLTSLAYGNNYFIAVGGSGSAAAASLSGAPSGAWINQSTNILTNSSGYTAIAYGAGLFLAIGGTVSAYMKSDPTSWTSAGTLTNKTWTGLAYGNGRFVALASDGTIQYNFMTWGPTSNGAASTPAWTTINNNPLNKSGITTWKNIRYSEGQFFAIATGTATCATSWDGLNWTVWSTSPNAMPSSSAWTGLAFGNPQNATLGAVPTWVSVSNTSGSIASYIQTGATPLGRTKVVTQQISEIRMIEPGSGFPRGNITATTYYAGTSVTISSSATTTITLSSNATLVQNQPIVFSTSFGNVTAGTTYYVYATTAASTSLQISTTLNGSLFTVGSGGTGTATVSSLSLITADSTTNLVANQPILFNGTSQGGITTGQYYYIVTNSITSTQFQISLTAGGSSFTATTAAISNMTYFASPIVTITDPNSVNKAPVTPRIGNGVVANPSITNRGVGNTTATTNYSGDGYADLYQTGSYINVSGLYQIPKAGCNVTFSGISNTWYKLVQVTNQLGIAGNYSATFQINPSITTLLAQPNGTQITTNLLYSNTRMTGHDFLYIGTGGFTPTNYPNIDPTKAVQANQTLATGGGRVFFTSTDQDGNFNVGNLFGVQQSTGTATLNASAFNLSGLNSLTLGSVSVGIGSATITQFSTDPYFTANSDNVVPTQKAIKAFITAQIGGGQSTLNVNTITSGQIYISGNTISNTNNAQIYFSSKVNFVGGIDGAPVALAFFGQK